MKAIQYSTNQYGEFLPFTLRPAAPGTGCFAAQKMQPVTRSGFTGMGVAVTGSSCYNLSRMTAEDRKEILERVYGAEGLGLSVARLSVGSSDYSAELYSYDDVPGDEELAHFSVARDEEYIIPMIREILAVRPDLKIFASPWSPPGWMKTGNSLCGGYMREKYLGCYARYLVKFVQAYREHGIEICALTPQNEPETHQRGRMPACIWHPETEAKFIGILKEDLRKAGLRTEIWMYDHNFDGVDRVDWTLSEYPNLQKDCAGIAFHYYNGCPEQTAFLREKYPELRLHFTEGGPRLFDRYDSDWCKWGTVISSVLNSGYVSFTGWNLMLDEAGGPNVGPFFCGGLITRNRTTEELSYSGQYKAFRHVAPFLGPDSQIFPLTFQGTTHTLSAYPKLGLPLSGTAVENLDGSQVLFLVNPNQEKAQVHYSWGGEHWYLELLPDTLSTVVFRPFPERSAHCDIS